MHCGNVDEPQSQCNNLQRSIEIYTTDEGNKHIEEFHTSKQQSVGLTS